MKMMLVHLKEAAIEVCNVDDTAAWLITAHLKLVRTKITVASILCISNVKCLYSAIFSLHGGMIFVPLVLLHRGKFGNKLPEQTKFKWSGLSVSRQVLNCLLMEIFLSSTMNDLPHHRLRTPWRWLCLVWNLIDGWLSLVVRSYRRGSLWMITISKELPKRVMSQSSQIEVRVEIRWIVPRSAEAMP